MRRLHVLVLVESLALVVLGSFVALRGDTAPVAPTPGTIAQRSDGPDAGSRTTRVEQEQRGEVRSSDPMRRVVDREPQDRPDLVLHGLVIPPAGESVPTDLGIQVRRDGTTRFASIVGDRYAVAGLSPGTWELQVRSPGMEGRRESIEIDGSEVQRHDVVLARAAVVRVFLRTPAGKPWLPPARAQVRMSHLTVAAFEHRSPTTCRCRWTR